MRNGFLLTALLLPLLIAGGARADGLEGVEDPVYCESPTSNWYIGADLAVLKPHLGTIGLNAPVEIGLTPQFGYTGSPRFTLGWENEDGLGIRAKYWQLDASGVQDYPAPLLLPGGVSLFGLRSTLEARTLDIEATQRGCLGFIQFQLSGGFRYAKMETGLSGSGEIAQFLAPPVPFDGGLTMNLEGGGPTIGIDFSRPFGSRGLALVGGLRSSWIFGQTTVGPTGDAAVFPVQLVSKDHMMQIHEVNLGVAWSRCLARGGKLTLAALWEAQSWEWAPLAGLFHQDIGLTGPTFSISYLR